MLSVPSLSQMLTVIGVALFATVVLTAALGALIARVHPTPAPGAPLGQVPAQRQDRHRTPVTTR